jgi:hypothetical protein
MNNIPIIIIHSGEFQWFKEVVEQASQQNKVIVLADERYADLPNSYNVHEFDKYVKMFDSVYVNLSSNGRWFEFAAFCRWFRLYEFMERNKIEIAFHPDTDVLIYADVTEEYYKKFSAYDLTLIKGACGAATFITLPRLRSFIEYVLNIYMERGSTFRAFTDMFAQFQRDNRDGGICDMTLWESYRRRFEVPYAEMTDIIDGETYDHTLNDISEYDDQAGHKYIWFENGVPYGRHMPDRKNIKFMVLHFQGQRDALIPEFMRKADDS